MKFANRVQRLEKSATMRVKEKALRLQAAGIDVIDLTAGEPDFPTPQYICEAGKAAIQEGFTKYTASAGILELRQAIARKFQEENGLSYGEEQIIVTAGAKPAIATVLLAILNPGDEVLIPQPFWVSYPQQVRLAGGEPVFVDTSTTNFKITPEQLQEHLTARTRAFIFNSPCNPTGVVYSREELALLAEVLAQYPDVWIVSDEIYEKLIYDGWQHSSLAQFPQLFHRTIVINGFSKAYAMTGWRIGYAAGPEEVIQSMGAIQSHFATAASISQRAALKALQGNQEALSKMRMEFENRRNWLLEKFQNWPMLDIVYPRGAFYLFFNVAALYGKSWRKGMIQSAEDFCDFLAEEHHLIVVPGSGFGSPDFVRLSFAASQESLQKGMEALDNALQQLQKS